MRERHFRGLLLVLLVGLTACQPAERTSEVPGSSTYWSRPTLAADPAGRLAMVWADLAEGGSGSPNKGNILRFSSLNGGGWSVPTRIYSKAREDWFIAHPQLAADERGFYLTWSGWTALYFGRADGTAEDAPGRWSGARRIAATPAIDRQAMLVDRQGRIHVIYTCLGGDLGGDGNLYYLSSPDRGDGWSEPVVLSRPGKDAETVAANPQLVEDRDGGLHAVWAERAAPGWLGVRILSTRSGNRGDSWSTPEIRAQVTGNETWADAPSLTCAPNGSLHLVWVCGEVPHRCYSSSDDRGRTWSDPTRLPGGLVSLAGWDALLADARGTLHLIAQLRFPMGMYHAIKRPDSPWRAPEALTLRPGYENGHYPTAVLTPGDEIHAVWQRTSLTGEHVYLRLSAEGEILEASFLDQDGSSGPE